MDPVLKSARWFLRTLVELIDGVRARTWVGGERPRFASKAAAKRLAGCIWMVEAYLRRTLLWMALEIEPTLVDDPKPMRRPHGRKAIDKPRPLKVLDLRYGKLTDDVRQIFKEAEQKKGYRYRRPPPPKPVHMDRLYKRLDQLAAIAADPLKRARRLAYRLARTVPGIIVAPDLYIRRPSHMVLLWNTEASMTFGLLAYDIITKSRSRPPQLSPPRLIYPMATYLDW